MILTLRINYFFKISTKLVFANPKSLKYLDLNNVSIDTLDEIICEKVPDYSTPREYELDVSYWDTYGKIKTFSLVMHNVSSIMHLFFTYVGISNFRMDMEYFIPIPFIGSEQPNFVNGWKTQNIVSITCSLNQHWNAYKISLNRF